jgi:hypothetical protein
MISKEAVESMATATDFQIILGFYVLELAIILTYFAAKVAHGDNRTAIMLSMAKSIPIAMIVFSVALFFGGMILGGIGG